MIFRLFQLFNLFTIFLLILSCFFTNKFYSIFRTKGFNQQGGQKMRRFEIRLIADDEVKELVAIANNISEIHKLLKTHYTLNNYIAITIKTQG